MDTIGEIRARIVGLDELARYLDLHGLTKSARLSESGNTANIYCSTLDRYDELSMLVGGDPADPAVTWWGPQHDVTYFAVVRTFGGGVSLQVFTDREPMTVHPFDTVDAA